MKTRWILLAVAVAAISLAWFQQQRLRELKVETTELEAMADGGDGGDGGGGGEAVGAKGPAGDAGATPAQLDRFKELVVGAMVAAIEGRRMERDEQMRHQKELLELAREFSAGNIGDLVEALRADERIPGEQVALEVVELVQQVAPFAVLEYLESNRDLEDWQEWYSRCFRDCLRDDRRRALERYDREAADGNADFSTTGVRQAVLMELSVDDPERMLALVATPELAGDPDALLHLGGFVDDRMESFSDHQRFMAALRGAAEEDSAVVAKIREDFVREISSTFAQWPFDEVKLLVESEFTPDERLHAILQASHRADLEPFAAWGDWFLKVDPGEWEAWVSSQPGPRHHPAVRLAESWARMDPDAASAWLERVPAGELRDEVILNFAWALADQHPGRAAGYLDELPDSKRKRNLARKIEQAGE